MYLSYLLTYARICIFWHSGNNYLQHCNSCYIISFLLVIYTLSKNSVHVKYAEHNFKVTHQGHVATWWITDSNRMCKYVCQVHPLSSFKCFAPTVHQLSLSKWKPKQICIPLPCCYFSLYKSCIFLVWYEFPGTEHQFVTLCLQETRVWFWWLSL